MSLGVGPALTGKADAVGSADPSTCPLCTASAINGFHADAHATYLRCDVCALVFLRPDLRPTPLREVMRYQEHRNEFGDPQYLGFLRRLADPLRDRLAPGARGLDFGCGPQPVLAEFLSEAGFPSTYYDPLFHPDASVLAEQYDFITCSEVLEHVHDPRAVLERFASLLGNATMNWIAVDRSWTVEFPAPHLAVFTIARSAARAREIGVSLVHARRPC